MNKKKNIWLLFSFLTVVLGVLYLLTYRYSFYGNPISPVIMGGEVFRAEVVSTKEKLEKGLGNRNDMCASCAMLFRFSKSGKYSFWMRDMRFPLDIIWISDGKIVHIEKNIQQGFSGILEPSSEADFVLEINAGLSEKFGIKIGDRVVGI